MMSNNNEQSILVVDDDMLVRKVLKKYISSLGYYVDTAGKDAKRIQAYIQNQLKEDQMGEQLTFEDHDPFTGSK